MAKSRITPRKGDMQYEAVIESTTRLKSSTNGNPRWQLHLKGGDTVKTQVDASVSYGINNPGMIGEPVIITATASGLVWAVEPIADLKD